MVSPPANSSEVSSQSTRPSFRAMKPSRLAAMWIVTCESGSAIVLDRNATQFRGRQVATFMSRYHETHDNAHSKIRHDLTQDSPSAFSGPRYKRKKKARRKT